MNFKTTIFLLVLLAGVGVYFGVQHWTGRNNSTPVETNSAKLVDVNSSDVTKITMTQPDGKRLVLNKAGTQWRLSEPMDAPADTFAVEDLLRALTGLSSRGQLPVEQVGSVGLDHPNYVVELTGKDGKVTKVSVGQKSEISNAMYVLVNDRKQPDIVASDAYAQLEKPASAYRSKKLVDVNNDQVKQIAITRNGKTVRLQKSGSDWEITEPSKMPADTNAVSDLLFAITGLNATEFVQNPDKPAVYGLSKPATVVWFSTAPPAPEAQPAASARATEPAGTTIAFGRPEDVLEKNVYASVNGGPIVTVSTSSQSSFQKTALDLRDKKVLDIDPAHVEDFTLAVNTAATTQPTTRPAAQHEYRIVRHKEIFGPLPPPSGEPASSKPSTTRNTRSAVASTEPGTQPASTRPAVAATQPSSKWVFESGASGPANDTEVQNLLDALHPLKAEKFLEKSPTTQPAGTYTLTIHAGPANGKGPQDYALRFTSPGATGPAIGSYNDLKFEVDRSILDKLDSDFRTTKAPAAEAPKFPGGSPDGFH